MCAYRGSHSYRSSYSPYPEYVPVADKVARNRAAAAKLSRRDGDAEPVVIAGRAIASSWWGKSWNNNLERYADYSNRIGRGRSYVRHGAVLDLKIRHGAVAALVQGSRAKPYEVTVTIAPLAAAAWEKLRAAALGSLDSLTDLLAGKFPQALKDIFFAQGTGLFPEPKEIKLKCSCPDWATMCKHVAAVLYGVGNRLDQAPELLFTLRGVTVDELVRQAVETTQRHLLDKAEQAAGDDLLSDADIGEVFGIEVAEMNALPSSPPPREARPKKISADSAKRGGPATSPPRRGKKPAAAPAPTPRKRGAKPAATGQGGMVDRLLTAVPVKKAFSADDIAEKLPGWTRQQIANTIQRGIAEARLQRVARGKYRRSQV